MQASTDAALKNAKKKEKKERLMSASRKNVSADNSVMKMQFQKAHNTTWMLLSGAALINTALEYLCPDPCHKALPL